MKKFSLNKAFTLLELLVVIGIIAILLALGSVSYSTAQKKSRDARRQGDLQALQKVLEQCYSISGTYQYPAISGNNSPTVSASCAGGPSITITDPTGQNYTVTGGAGAIYTVTVTLESGSTYSVSQQQ